MTQHVRATLRVEQRKRTREESGLNYSLSRCVHICVTLQLPATRPSRRSLFTLMVKDSLWIRRTWQQ
ncbi:hypothetical protein scyTo_0012557 [Scyliorhinus torazame]|uniref:Uncharacterized protein n=1 Tax=Scyliorhinus torazame TaxID=75743 RepID=A0A401PAH7_SCYTO|nr:hypothetical protein [Scyliorhinus torazame]